MLVVYDIGSLGSAIAQNILRCNNRMLIIE